MEQLDYSHHYSKQNFFDLNRKTLFLFKPYVYQQESNQVSVIVWSYSFLCNKIVWNVHNHSFRHHWLRAKTDLPLHYCTAVMSPYTERATYRINGKPQKSVSLRGTPLFRNGLSCRIGWRRCPLQCKRVLKILRFRGLSYLTAGIYQHLLQAAIPWREREYAAYACYMALNDVLKNRTTQKPLNV